MDMTNTRNCDTCRHDLGGGCCRINLEAECAAGEFEAWEPKEADAESDTDETEVARARMVHGFGEFISGLVEFMTLSLRKVAEGMGSIDWSALAAIKETDPDLFNWTARGPIRRVQMRRARAMMEGKHGKII